MSGIGEQKTRTIVDALFGKPFESLGCEDIVTLVEAGWSESTHLEFKTLKPGMSKNEIKSKIIRSLVGFLNSEIGEGVLILGVKGDDGAEQIECVPYSLLGKRKDVVESKVRNWAFEHIGSIPRTLTPPVVEVKALDCREHGLGEGWLIPVYAKRIDDVLYYSKLNNQAFRRSGSQTNTLRLEEAISIIEAKKQPKVLITLDPETVKTSEVKLYVGYYNIGSRPAEAFTAILSISKHVRLGKSLLYSGVVRPRIVDDITRLVPIEITSSTRRIAPTLRKEMTQIKLQVSGSQYTDMPLFPGIDFKIGIITLSFSKLKNENALMMPFQAIVYTELNYSMQRCQFFLDLLSPSNYAQLCEEFYVADYSGRKIFELPREKTLLIDKRGIKYLNSEQSGKTKNST